MSNKRFLHDVLLFVNSILRVYARVIKKHLIFYYKYLSFGRSWPVNREQEKIIILEPLLESCCCNRTSKTNRSSMKPPSILQQIACLIQGRPGLSTWSFGPPTSNDPYTNIQLNYRDYFFNQYFMFSTEKYA